VAGRGAPSELGDGWGFDPSPPSFQLWWGAWKPLLGFEFAKLLQLVLPAKFA